MEPAPGISKIGKIQKVFCMDSFFTPKIIRSKRRSMSLHLLPGNSLVVRAPLRTSDREIHQFIEKNRDWIEKQAKKIEKMPKVVNRTYKNGEEFLYLGKIHTLEIGNYKEITVSEDKILFPEFLKFRIQKELTSWYIAKGKEIITQQVEWNAKEMSAHYSALSFADTKSRWGSCTHDNKLQFNWRLIMAPLLVIRYVVVHELVHTLEKNHSKDFWNRVSFQSPSYKTQRKWLKDNGNALVI